MVGGGADLSEGKQAERHLSLSRLLWEQSRGEVGRRRRSRGHAQRAGAWTGLSSRRISVPLGAREDLASGDGDRRSPDLDLGLIVDVGGATRGTLGGGELGP